jgi:hypothetical protein
MPVQAASKSCVTESIQVVGVGAFDHRVPQLAWAQARLPEPPGVLVEVVIRLVSGLADSGSRPQCPKSGESAADACRLTVGPLPLVRLVSVRSCPVGMAGALTWRKTAITGRGKQPGGTGPGDRVDAHRVSQ